MDEDLHGMLMKARRPRAVVLCPTRELCEQVSFLVYLFSDLRYDRIIQLIKEVHI